MCTLKQMSLELPRWMNIHCMILNSVYWFLTLHFDQASKILPVVKPPIQVKSLQSISVNISQSCGVSVLCSICCNFITWGASSSHAERNLRRKGTDECNLEQRCIAAWESCALASSGLPGLPSTMFCHTHSRGTSLVSPGSSALGFYVLQ